VAASGAGLAFAVSIGSAFGLARSVRLAFGTVAAAVRCGVGARDTEGVTAGASATGRAIDACIGPLANVPDDSGAAGCAGTSTTLRSVASIRRSRQANPKPGSPKPSPLRIRLNNSPWIRSESSSAYASRLLRCLSALRWYL
jgi:hypothetical protein